MSWKNKRVLIAGGAGKVGSQVAHKLFGLGSIVTIADNFTSGLRKNVDDLQGTASINIADLRDERNCIRETKYKDVVVQLAMNTGGAGRDTEKASILMHDNLLININMLHAAFRNKVKRYLCCLPVYVYPMGVNQFCGPEKIAVEKLCDAYRHDYGMDIKTIHFKDFDDCMENILEAQK